MDVIVLSMYLLRGIKGSCLRPHCHQHGLVKQPIPPKHQGLSSLSSTPPCNSPFPKESLFAPWYADSLCCPCMPSLLMEGLASMHLSHTQFTLVDWVSQANIYSGPKPLGRIFYNINSSSQWGGLFSSSSLPFSIAAQGLWDVSMTFLCKVQWPTLGQLGSPTDSNKATWCHFIWHLRLEVLPGILTGSSPCRWRILNLHLVVQSGKFLIKQPTPPCSLEERSIQQTLGRFRRNLFRLLPYLSCLLKFNLKFWPVEEMY